MGFIEGKLVIMVVTEGVRVLVTAVVSTHWSVLGQGQLIFASAPDISRGILLCGFKRTCRCQQGRSGAETLLRPRCSLQFDGNSVSLVNSPKALFQRPLDTD